MARSCKGAGKVIGKRPPEELSYIVGQDLDASRKRNVRLGSTTKGVVSVDVPKCPC